MKSINKTLIVILAVVAVVVASVLGTLAYLTDRSSVENTFTVGNVDIKLDEAVIDEDGNPVDGFHDWDNDDYIIYDPNDSGGTVHYYPKPTAGDIIKMVLISLVAGLVAAAIFLGIMRANFNTFRQQSNASSYLGSQGFRLTRKQDTFLYSNVSKTLRETTSSSGGSSSRSSFRGGGSSTHRSSSGRSHGGRSGKF